jgi:hypothetical protein
VAGWILYAVQYGAVVVGHIAGQTRALFVKEREAGIEPQVLNGPAGAPSGDAIAGEESPRRACPARPPDLPALGTPEPLPGEAEPDPSPTEDNLGATP